MNKINTRKALNPAYRKHNPRRKDVDNFKDSLLTCLKTIKEIDQINESEEHLKEPIKTFFQETFYKDHLINTKDRIDLAIYTGKDVKSDVGVIIEAKKPSNKSEFISANNLNKKALQELLLYYLRERIDNNNNNIKHLIATNGYEWFLFKSEDFYKFFYKNKSLLKEYDDFKVGLKDSSKTDLFYSEIASKYISEVMSDLPFVHLDFTKKALKDYSDQDLNTLYKVFSDVNVLGKSFGNDSNELNKEFYNELLYIVGLEEFKDKGKKIIYRKKEEERQYSSLLESAIFTLEDKNYLQNVTRDKDKAFNAGLTLCLTWVNRILFLKLLESQLVSYHDGDKNYRFLNSDFITGFDDLNDLFFSALAKDIADRHPKFKDKYKRIPYLNSSLFEKNDLENDTFDISALNDEEIEVYNFTILKEPNGKKFKGKLNTLDYLFKFLDSFDFATDGTEGISDETEVKTLINASVLGMIFEKINGYKEGSFFTPAYITMYMCRETLRKAVVQKFKENENDQIENYEDLISYCHNFFKHEDRNRLNKVFNTLKICDPAVGSGHFLVSALNELVAIKQELGLLIDAKGKRLSDYDIHIVNDELYITDEKGFLFEYKPNNSESVRIQHTLFHEKQSIIENCLFGVDINPNSVKICRLRLWVELLKNAYYTKDEVLQTLPNIDINIKSGNSLISRFNLKDDLSDAFKGEDVKYTFNQYREAVQKYKETNDKQVKKDVLEIINEVKINFKSKLDNKFLGNFQKLQGAYINEKNRLENLKQFDETISKKEVDNLKRLKNASDKAQMEKNEIIDNVIFHDAFEWRFEFPEVLDEKGSYIGFDVILGNPPYFGLGGIDLYKNKYFIDNFSTYKCGDIYAVFCELANDILREKGLNSFIISNKWLRAGYGETLREFFTDKTKPIRLIDFGQNLIFDSATVHTNIIEVKKDINDNKIEAVRFNDDDDPSKLSLELYFDQNKVDELNLTKEIWNILPKEILDINKKVVGFKKLKEYDISINFGLKTGYNEAFIIDENKFNTLCDQDPKNREILKPILRGRDTRRYYCNYHGFYIIHSHNGNNQKKIDRIKVEEDYPSIYNHLLEFEEKSKKRYDKGEHWTNLRNCAYIDEFEKPKIIFSEIVSEPQFYYDEENYYPEATVFFITGEKLKYLTALLNSKALTFLFKNFYMGGELVGKIRYKKAFLENVPIPYPSEQQEGLICSKVDSILALKKDNKESDITDIENEIDKIVYELYGFSKEEIKIVEES